MYAKPETIMGVDFQQTAIESPMFVIITFITGKYPTNLVKQQNYVVAESESFIVITGINAYRTFLFDCYSHSYSNEIA